MTFVAGTSSLADALLAITLLFAGGVSAGFGGSCLPVNLVLFSPGGLDSPPNSSSKLTGFAELLLAREAADGLAALLERGLTSAGGGFGGPLLFNLTFFSSGTWAVALMSG